MASYSKRESFFEKAEHLWTIDGSGLHITRQGSTSHIHFASITRLRLSYAPTQLKANRYTCEVFVSNGARFEIDNMHFYGIGDFEDRSESYCAMVSDLLLHIAQDRPDFMVDIGSGAYWLLVGFLMAAYGAFLWVINVATEASWNISALVKLGIVLVTLPLLVAWLISARPRRARIDAVPPEAVPSPSS